MKNCYSLKLPTLSTDLNQDLLKFGQSFTPAEGFDVINLHELGKDTQIWVDFHNHTGTTRSSYIQFDLSPDLQSRIKTEMTDELFPFSKVNFYMQLVIGGEKLMPHRDPGRTLSILYNISSDHAVTHFYHTHINDADKYLFAIDETEEIESHRMVPHQWHVFNNEAIHGVSQMFTNRLAITCRLNADQQLNLPNYQTFFERYQHLLDV